MEFLGPGISIIDTTSRPGKGQPDPGKRRGRKPREPETELILLPTETGSEPSETQPVEIPIAETFRPPEEFQVIPPPQPEHKTHRAPALPERPAGVVMPKAMQEYLERPGSVHLSERQVVWVLHRLGQEDDLYACVSAGVDPEEVIRWRQNPLFGELIESALVDKKGTFRDVTSNLLPLAGRVIYDMLASGDKKAQNAALSRLVDIQGLKVTTSVQIDGDGLAKVLEALRESSPVKVIDMEPRP